MSYRRPHCRVDENQQGLIDFARMAGATVLITAAIGDGAPDIIVGVAGVDQQVEIKSAKGKLTPDQETFHSRWRGRKPVVWRCAADVLRTMQELHTAGAA